MTQDRNESSRPLFADIDDHDDELQKKQTQESGAAQPAGVDPMSVGQPGAAAIPLGAPTSVNEALDDKDPDEPHR